jgi:hypothetical protein
LGWRVRLRLRGRGLYPADGVSFDKGCRCRSISGGNRYLAAIRSEDLVGQVDGVIVLVGGPGHHGVAIVGEKSEYFVQSAEDWWMGKDL